MPSEKRERQRANRQMKMARLERQAKRRKLYKRGGAGIVAVAVIVGIVFAVSSTGGGKSKSTTTTTAIADNQALAVKADVAAGCPSSPTAPVKKRTWTTAPAMTVNQADTYSATIKTDVGSFTIALDAKNAPVTVNNFLFLAASDFYNCISFHRVIPGFMDQVGDPTGSGSGGPGYKFADENLPPNGYTTGEVAMANSGPNTNGSQFFILVGPYSQGSKGAYSLFGHVTSGMNVVQRINQDGTSSGTPTIRHRILSITVHSTGPGGSPSSTTAAQVGSSTSTTPAKASSTTKAPAKKK